jgi:hypothetical protein
VWHSTAFKITNYAMKPVIRKACPRAGRCNFGAHARAAFVMPHPERLGRGFPLVSGLVAMRFY